MKEEMFPLSEMIIPSSSPKKIKQNKGQQTEELGTEKREKLQLCHVSHTMTKMIPIFYSFP